MKQPELGRKIVELRKQKGLTQEELVEMCNINVRTIQRIESGEVTPRPYTVKTILAALGYNLDSVKHQENEITEVYDNPQKIDAADKIVTMAWIAGGIYFLLGFIEFAADWYRWFEDEMLFSNRVYSMIKISVLATYSIFMFGFIKTGELFENMLLKISALSIIGLSVLLYGYEIFSLHLELFPIAYFLAVMAVLFGAVGIAFGVSLIKLRKPLGVIALLTALGMIVVSLMEISVVFAWLGLLFYSPVIVLKIIMLYKVSVILKKQRANLE